MNERTRQGDRSVTDKDTEAAAGTDAETRPTPPAKKSGPVRVVRSGRGLGWLALLLALAALTLSSWDYLAARGWVPPLVAAPPVEVAEPVMDETRIEALVEARVERLLDPRLERLQRSFRSDLAVAEEQVADVADRLGSVRGQLRRELEREGEVREQAAADVERHVAELRRAVADLAQDLATATPPDTREWRVAEAGYLLRIANERARLERDLRGALALLQAADGILTEIDDYRLVPVREALLEAQSALEAQPQVDRIGLYLELERWVWSVTHWELAAPAGFEPARQPVDAEAEHWWSTVQQRLRGLVEIQRDQAGQRVVPLTPDARATLQHNIHLKLLHAQLALLRSEQGVWATSLETAADWAESVDDPKGDELAAGLRVLATTRIRPEVPDISAPLRLLDRLHLRDREDDA